MCLPIRRGVGCSKFIRYVHLQLRTWESYRAQRIIVTSLIRFAKKKKHSSMRVNRDLSNPDTNYNKRWSIVNRAMWSPQKIPHLPHSLFKTKCSLVIPREKMRILTSILCYRVNLQFPISFLLLSNTFRNSNFHSVCFRKASA